MFAQSLVRKCMQYLWSRPIQGVPGGGSSGRKRRRTRPRTGHRRHGFEPLESRSLLSVTLLSEGFEGDFPADNGWSVGDANTAGTTAYWNDVSSSFGGEGTHGGAWKGYAAGTNHAGTSGSPSYRDSMNAYMSRSINLSGLSSATLSFWYKIPSIESGHYDHLRAFIDTTKVFDVSSAATSWTQATINLNPYVGGTRTLKFEFYSDGSVTAEGAYLDDILVSGEQSHTVDLYGYDCYATDSAQWGQTINVQAQIRNAGTGASGPFQVAWYLSQDSTGSSDDIRLSRTGGGGDSYSHGGLAGNSFGPDFTVNLQLPAALPSGWSGTSFYVIQKTDAAGQVTESNESNNFGQVGYGYDRDPITIITPVQYPDLQGYDCYAPDSAQWGQTISVQAQIRNAGTGASGPFQVAWYLSQDSIGSSDDIRLSRTGGNGDSYSHAGLAANSFGPDFTVYLQLPGALPSGWSGTNFYVIQKTDAASQVAESNENNNFGQVGYGYDRDAFTTPLPYPDLQGYDCYAPDSAQWGQAISVQAQIRNAGTGASGPFQVAWYLSQDNTGTSDDIRLSRTGGGGDSYSHAGTAASSFGPDFTVNLQLPAALPSGWSGTSFYIIQKTDAAGQIAESNENNNFGQVGNGYDRDSITIITPVQYPDLQGFDCYAPDSAQWGQTISVQAQIRNAGTGVSGPFQVAWYLSPDSIGSSDDIRLSRTGGGGDSYSHAGLAANSLGPDFTVNLQLPAALPSGWSGTSFYIIQKTDAAGQVPESNENNNFGQVGYGYDRDPITITGASTLARLQNAWSQVDSELVRAFLGIEGGPLASRSIVFATVNSAMAAAISRAANSVGGTLSSTAEISFGVQINGEVTAGLPGLSVELAGIATGYNFTYDIGQDEWTISRDFSVHIGQFDVVFEQYITFDSLSAVPAQVTVGLSAAGQFSSSLAVELGEFFTVSLEAGVGQKLTFSAEAVLGTADFVNNCVHQGNGDATVTVGEFAAALADVFIPYCGDSWWENIVTGVASWIPVIPLPTLIDITRTDTVVGIVAHAPTVHLEVVAGTELSAGAALGLGGQIPILFPPAINVGASVSAGVSIAAGVETTPLYTATVSNWRPVNPDALPPSLTNGGFESGTLTGWTVTAGGQFPKLVTTTAASGSYALQLGDGGSGLGRGNTAAIQQTASIAAAATAPRLSLKYKVQGTDGPAWDWMRVFVNDTQVASWSTDTGGWQTFTYDLSAFKGRSVTVKLCSWTADTSLPVYYFLDDVRILT